MYFYTYYSYEPFGRGYIGSRGSHVEPNLDPYLGSYTDNTFNPTKKIVLSVCSTRKEALDNEIILHEFFEVDINPHFANKIKASAPKFCSHNMIRVNNGKKEKLVHKNFIPKGWKKGRLINIQTYINTPDRYFNDSRRGSMFCKFKYDVEQNPLILETSIRKLGKLYNTSHASILRWKKCISSSSRSP